MGEELQIMSEIPFDAQELANMAGYGGMYKKSKELKKLLPIFYFLSQKSNCIDNGIYFCYLDI